ncbi:MAG TPA: trypsin-like serine protease [Bdellovibrionota bacterium]|jgi:secreted trypsin-like serine protease
MKSLALLLPFLLSVPASAIINGETMKGTEPFAKAVVGLARKVPEGGYHIFCSGSILNEHTIVTAAHCLFERDGEIYAVFGLNEKSPDIQARQLERKVVKEGYKNAHRNDDVDVLDISLAQFRDPAPEGFKALPFLEDENRLTEGATVLLAGYGFDDPVTPKGSGTLRYTFVQIFDAHKARTEITTNEQRHGSCNIDSGGPGFITVGDRYFLWGATHNGSPGCVGEGVYTKVISYRDWIDGKLADTSSSNGWKSL